MLPAYEKLGGFYLGRDARSGPFVYEANHLLTHAVIAGMTGSGKTGLGVSLIEEAAIDGIPVIAIDPKGDLSNLALAFPRLDAASFAPWVAPGVDPVLEAARWTEGLASTDQDASRIARFRDACEVTVYTPGSSAGVPLSILTAMDPPSPEERSDREAFQARVVGVVAGLLGWIGIESDPAKSREHVLLSNIVSTAWMSGESLTLARIVTRVQDPSFKTIGALDLESYYPRKDRFELAVSLNGLIASPVFDAWTVGEPLDVASLFRTATGKARVSVISIAHLSDPERMFVVTTLLHAVVAWMRKQQGTTTLRGLIYMDEITGYFPPVANPVSKAPMLTLLKQARAYGLGIVLATQNPVDIDYKGLGNAGTWFLGRLQTERDKQRVLDGLESSLDGRASRTEIDAVLSELPKRHFYVHDVHASEPVVIESRWALSYLRGPLTKKELTRLTAKATPISSDEFEPPTSFGDEPIGVNWLPEKPALPIGIREAFVPTTEVSPAYEARLLGAARVRFANKNLEVDFTRNVVFTAAFQEGAIDVSWENDGRWLAVAKHALEADPREGASFRAPNTDLLDPTRMRSWEKAFEQWLEGFQGLPLFEVESLGIRSRPNEPETDFRDRALVMQREARDRAVATLREKWQSRANALEDRIARARTSLEQKRDAANARRTDAALSVGTAMLGAFLGRRTIAGAARSASTAVRGATRMSRAGTPVASEEERLSDLETDAAELTQEFELEANEIIQAHAPENLVVAITIVRPKKVDVRVEWFGIGWLAGSR